MFFQTVAQQLYQGAHIRSVVTTATRKNAQGVMVSVDDFTIEDPVVTFNEWLKAAKTPVSRPVAKLVRDLLKPPVVVAPTQEIAEDDLPF